jgi:hypothetical protein
LDPEMVALGVVPFAELKGPEFQISLRHNRSAGFLPAKTIDYSPMVGRLQFIRCAAII